jgi:uncharacterized protein (DUF433 family)
MATPAATPEKLYEVNKPIKYKNPNHPLFNQVIQPGLKKSDLAATYPSLEPKQVLSLKDFGKDEQILLPFPHLSDADLSVLLRTKTLIPA